VCGFPVKPTYSVTTIHNSISVTSSRTPSLIQNRNIATAKRSCLTLTSYRRCCQRNRRQLLTTGSDGRTLLTTPAVWSDNSQALLTKAVVWRQVEQMALLIFGILNQNFSTSNHLEGIWMRQQNQRCQLLNSVS